MPTKLLRAQKVADILDVPTDHVYGLVRHGFLPAIRVGRVWRFDEQKLRAWIERGGAGGWRREHGPREAAEAQ